MAESRFIDVGDPDVRTPYKFKWPVVTRHKNSTHSCELNIVICIKLSSPVALRKRFWERKLEPLVPFFVGRPRISFGSPESVTQRSVVRKQATEGLQ